MIRSGDFTFELDTGWERPPPGSGDSFVVRKGPDMIETYEEVIGPAMTGRNVAEVGILYGGAAAYMLERFKPAHLWAIDLDAAAGADLDRYIARTGAKNVSIHRGVGQDDEAALRRIVGEKPLHVVVDDASHFLDETRGTFEILFPLLEPGGLYVIEDWQWAHQDYQGGVPWPDRKALTNLIFELTVVFGTQPRGLIERITLTGFMALIWKSPKARVERTRLDLRSKMRLGPRRLPEI